VRRFDKLGGRLTKVAYHSFGCGAFGRIGDCVQIDSALVGAVHEDVESLLGFNALLLVAEYEVDPLVKMLAYVVTLQRLDEGQVRIIIAFTYFLGRETTK